MDASTLAHSCQCQTDIACTCESYSRFEHIRDIYAPSSSHAPSSLSTPQPRLSASYSVYQPSQPQQPYQHQQYQPQPPQQQQFSPSGTYPYYPPALYPYPPPPHYPPVSFPTTSPTPVAPQPSGRKRTAANAGLQRPQGSSQPKRAKARTSSSSNPVMSVTPAQYCGVGPSAGPISSFTIGSPSDDTNSSTPSTATASAAAVERVIRHKVNAKVATDVYWFLIPLKTNTRPSDVELVSFSSSDTLQAKPLLESKPAEKDFPVLACRICAKDAKWSPYRNTAGCTGTVRAHLQDKHGDIYYPLIRAASLKHANDVRLVAPQDEDFTVPRWIEKLMRWIVMNDQSLSVVDCPEFREFVLFGRTDVSEKDLPHRSTLRTVIQEHFTAEHEKLVEEFKQALGRISFTSDIWSDPNLAAFMALTAHFCARDESQRLVIRSRLLAFRLVEGAHDGASLGRILFGIWKEAGILHKLGLLTLDNAGNNGTMCETAEELCDEVDDPEVKFDAEGNHVRCFPHVINISTQTIARELEQNSYWPVIESAGDNSTATTSTGTSGDQAATPNIDLTSEQHEATTLAAAEKKAALERYAQALLNQPINKARELVGACRRSGSRRADLRQVIIDGNNTNAWGDGAPPLSVVQLLRDCETRWSSTYNMIGRMLHLYPAVVYFLNQPKQIGIIDHLFTETEFQILHDIHDIFSQAHAAQELLSAEKTPTLSAALPAFEQLLVNWLNMQKEIPELKHYIGVGIAKIQEYVTKGRSNKIYGMAMIINPTTKMAWIKKHWTSVDAAGAKNALLDAMTAYCTSKRHNSQKASDQARLISPLPLRRTAATSSAAAAEAQARGIANLNGLSVYTRRSASLPTIHLRSESVAASTTSSSTPNTRQSTPAPPPTPRVPIPAPISPEERVAREARELLSDRRCAEKELERYLDAPFANSDNGALFDIVRFWDENEKTYPLMFSVALDVLPVQASAVPCERIFSSSKETCTARRNRLSTDLIEWLQFLKHLFKQERLNFCDRWLAKEEDYAIEGELSEFALRELITRGKYDELQDLVNNLPPASSPLA